MCVSRILKKTHYEGGQKLKKKLTRMDGTTWLTYPILRDFTLINVNKRKEIKGIYLYIIIQFIKNTMGDAVSLIICKPN